MRNGQCLLRSAGAPDRLTPNETAWVEFLRLLSRDSDPPLTLSAVQALRRAVAPDGA